MSVTTRQLALVQRHRDDINSDDHPGWAHPHELLDALDAVLAQVTRFPGTCGECATVAGMTKREQALESAARDFVVKVESGRAFSRDSYQKFKAALAVEADDSVPDATGFSGA